MVAEVEIAAEVYCLSGIVNQPKDWTDKSMNRKELIERLRCLPLDEPAEFTAVKDAVIVPQGNRLNFRVTRDRKSESVAVL